MTTPYAMPAPDDIPLPRRRIAAAKKAVFGTPPSLWVLAQAQFILGVVSLGAGFVLGLISAIVAWGLFKAEGSVVAMACVTAAFTFGTPGALFLFGASVTRYLAAREAREYAAPIETRGAAPSRRDS